MRLLGQPCEFSLQEADARAASPAAVDIEGAEGVPNSTAAGLVRLFKELREASVAYGFNSRGP